MSVELLTQDDAGMLRTFEGAFFRLYLKLMLKACPLLPFPSLFCAVVQVDSIDNGALVSRGPLEAWEPDNPDKALAALGHSSSTSTSSSRSSTDSKSPAHRAAAKWLTVVGQDFSLPLSMHEAYKVSGEWTKHPTYGWQIRSGRCTHALMECSCACC